MTITIFTVPCRLSAWGCTLDAPSRCTKVEILNLLPDNVSPRAMLCRADLLVRNGVSDRCLFNLEIKS